MTRQVAVAATGRRRSRPDWAWRPRAATRSTRRWPRRSSRWAPSRAWSASPAAPSSRSGPPAGIRSSSTATSRCPVAACPERFGHGVREVVTDVRRRGHHARRSRLGRHPGHRAGVRAGDERLGALPWAAPGRTRGRGAARVPDRPAAARYLGIIARHPVRPRPRGARRWSRAPTARCGRRRGCSQRRPRRRPRRARGQRAGLFVHGEVGRGLVEDMARQRRPRHRRRPRGVPARRAARVRPRRRRLDARHQPAAVGRRPDARRDARRAGPPRQLDLVGRIEIQQRCCRYRATVHDCSHDLEPTATSCSPRSTSTASPGCGLRLDRAHLRRGRRGQRLRDHHGSGYGAGISSRAPASCSTTALGEPELNRHGVHARASGHAARLQHGADDGAQPPTAGRWPSAPRAPTGSPPR